MIAGWKHPRIVKIPLQTASIAIDSRNRHIYARTLRDGSSSNSVGKVARFHLDQDEYPPANYGDTGTNRVTSQFHYEWCFEGNSDKGIAVAPNGNLAVVGKSQDGLRIFAGGQTKVPWEATKIADLPNNAGGVRFDLAGNLYLGYIDQKPTTALAGFEDDRHMAAIGRIHKYAPTGTLESGNLFPNSVDATDNYIYVADMVNLRLLRLKKNYQAVAWSR